MKAETFRADKKKEKARESIKIPKIRNFQPTKMCHTSN